MKRTTNDRPAAAGLDSLSRRAPQLEPEQRLLIVCDGEKTELSYFRKFRLPLVEVEIIGTGFNTVQVVAAAAALAAQQPAGYYEQVWCVFDRDDFPADRFDAAVTQAAAAGYGAAYSNQAFEFWLLLHFAEYAGPLHRDEYHYRLNEHLAPLSARYGATKEVTVRLFELLQSIDPLTGRSLRELAIARARALDEDWERTGQPPSQRESTTAVYKLVAILERYL